MRRLSELLAVYDKMPDGRAKQALDEVVHRQLAEVRARYMTAFKREDPGKLGKALIGVGLVFYFVGLFGVAVLDARGDREAGSDASVMFAAVFALGLIVMGFGAWRGTSRRRYNLLKESRRLLGIDEKGNWTPEPSGQGQRFETSYLPRVTGHGNEPASRVDLQALRASAGSLGQQPEDVQPVPAHRTLNPRTWVRRKDRGGES